MDVNAHQALVFVAGILFVIAALMAFGSIGGSPLGWGFVGLAVFAAAHL